MKKKLFISLVFSVIIYILIAVYFGPGNLLAVFNKISALHIIIAFGFVLLSLFFEFLRWEFYLAQLKIKLSRGKSLQVFLSGLSMGFLPAKSGELLRYYLMKRNKVPYKKTVPIHFISNITVLLVVLAFSSPFLILYTNMLVFYITIILIFTAFFSFRFPIIYLKTISAIQKLVNLKLFSDLKKSILYSKKLLGIRELFISISLTFIYYGMMGIVFFLISSNFEMDIPWYLAFAIYSLSLIIGVLSMLPGGIGAVEGSSIALLMNHMDGSSAVVLVMLMRILTLWLTIFIGIIAVNFSIFRGNLYKKKLDSVS